MKNKLVVGVLLGISLITASIKAAVTYSLTIPDAHAVLLTNNVGTLNTNIGIVMSVTNAIQIYGIKNLTNPVAFQQLKTSENFRMQKLITSAMTGTNFAVRSNIITTLSLTNQF